MRSGCPVDDFTLVDIQENVKIGYQVVKKFEGVFMEKISKLVFRAKLEKSCFLQDKIEKTKVTI